MTDHIVAYDRIIGHGIGALRDRGAGDDWSYPDGRTKAGRDPVPVVQAMDTLIALDPLDGSQVWAEYEDILAKLGCRR